MNRWVGCAAPSAADRVLLELAIGDILAIVRRSLDRNRRGDGTPSAAYAELAMAVERFDRLGGGEALTVALWHGDLDDECSRPSPVGSGAIRLSGSAGASSVRHAVRPGPVGSGAVRHSGSAGRWGVRRTMRLAPARSGAVAALANHQRRTSR